MTSLQLRPHPVKDIFGVPRFVELQAEAILPFDRECVADAPERMGAFPAFEIAPPLSFIPRTGMGTLS